MMIVLSHRLMKQYYHSTNDWGFLLLLLLFNYTFWYHSYIPASFSLLIFFTSLTRTLTDAKGNSSVDNFNQEYSKIWDFLTLWDYDDTEPKGGLGWCHVTWSQFSVSYHVQIITIISQLNYTLESFTSSLMFQRGKNAILALFPLKGDYKFLE